MLEGARLSLRPLVPADLDRLRAIVAEPSVNAWWDPSEFDAWAPEEGLEQFAIVVGDEIAGMIQYGEEEDPRYRHASIDLFLATVYQSRALGAEAVELLARHLFTERGHHRVVIDPAADNERAIRSYARVGFKPVGVMRAYELDHNTGEWRDGLLMDLLAGELPDPDAAPTQTTRSPPA
jgi:aminoglycoside 6'-N-acetyltransferase